MTYEWAVAERWVRRYSWLTLIATVLGLFAAHAPFLSGTPWTTCQKHWSPLGCSLTLHLLEAPIALYQTFFAVYGLRKLRAHAEQYMILLGFAVPLLALFAFFEVLLLLDIFRRGAPDWEIGTTFALAIMMMTGVVVGLFVHLKLRGALTPPSMRPKP